MYGKSVQPLNDCTQTKIRRTKIKQKAPDGNQALNKIIQSDYITKGTKMKVTVYAYGRKLDPDEPIIIPEGHRFYDVLHGIVDEALDKEEIA